MRTTPKLGLFSWDQLGDDYNFSQLAQNFQTIDYHDHSAGRGTQIPAGGLAPGAVLSSNIAANQVGFQHLSLSAAQNLGVNIPGQVSQGYTPIATSQSITSTSYVAMATPDQVANITIASGGLIFIAYQATWSNSVASAGNAAIFIGGNQLVLAPSSGATAGPAAQAAAGPATAAIANPLFTTGVGLISGTMTGAYTGDLTTGQIVGGGPTGGVVAVFAAAGTYNVTVMFKATSGSVTVLNRKLWVWTRNFN